MKILLDMNLSPMLCGQLAGEGWQTAHWQDIGAPDAPDREIMAWALEHGYVVCTNDLDFGTLLAQTQSGGPSVIQFRLGISRLSRRSPCSSPHSEDTRKYSRKAP